MAEVIALTVVLSLMMIFGVFFTHPTAPHEDIKAAKDWVIRNVRPGD